MFPFSFIGVKNIPGVIFVDEGIRFKLQGVCVAGGNKKLGNGKTTFKMVLETYTSGCIMFG